MLTRDKNLQFVFVLLMNNKLPVTDEYRPTRYSLASTRLINYSVGTTLIWLWLSLREYHARVTPETDTVL